MDRANNQKRLVWLVETFGISIKGLADICGKSAPYVSRIVNGDAGLGSPEFYAAVEKNLTAILELRTVRIFDVPVVNIAALEAIPDPQQSQRNVA